MDEHAQLQTATPRHEPIETDVRSVLITGVVLAIVVTLAFLLVTWLLSWLSARTKPLAAEQPKGDAAKYDPKWNVPPQSEQLRLQEKEFLSTYRWVQQEHGVARVPVDRAIDLIVEKGLPPAIGPVGATLSAPQQQAAPIDAVESAADSGDE
jgi:hypothetical protein